MTDKLATVARYTDYVEADLARQRLEDKGIKVFVVGQNAAVAWGIPPLGGIELQTPQDQAGTAREILEAARGPKRDEKRDPGQE